MKLESIRALAKSISINPNKLSKTKLIKKIQVQGGNFDCFATACNSECDQMNCLWREDCFAAVCGGTLS